MTKSIRTNAVILYADDDVDDLELVKDAFAQYSKDVEVITFTNGNAALSYLKGLPPDDPSPCLIILDINMPLVSGKETLMRLRTMDRFKRTPVVMFTTSSQPIDERFAHQYGAGFITKPIDVKQMEMIADQFMEHCTEEIKQKIRKQIQ